MKTCNKIILILIISLILFLLYYFFFHVLRNKYPYNPKERNKIVFKNSIADVRDSLSSLMILLNKMPVDKHNNNLVEFCIGDSDEISINYSETLKTDSFFIIKKYSINELEPLTVEEQNQFIRLVLYLKSNYLFRCDFYKNINQLEYCYREHPHKGDYHTYLLRFIILNNSSHQIDTNWYKILDKKGDLFLCAYKEAIIWEGENK